MDDKKHRKKDSGIFVKSDIFMDKLSKRERS